MSNLDFDFVDDMNVGVNPDTYPDQSNPAPVPACNYLLRVTKFDVQRDKEGNAVVYKNAAGEPAYPVYIIEQAEVQEPSELAGRKIGLFQQVTTKPFNRNGEIASQMGDLLRSLDQSVAVRGTKAMIEAVTDLIINTPIPVRLDWEANDFGFVKAEFERLFNGKRYGELDPSDKNVASGIYKRAKCAGQRNFPTFANGKRNHVWTGPSGDTFEARSKIVRYHPSLASIKFVLPLD